MKKQCGNILIKYLTYEKENLNMKKIKKIVYLAGVVINQDNLRKFVNSNMPNSYCHHMTVKYGNIDKLPDFLGSKFKFTINKIFFNEKGIAASGVVGSTFIKKIMEETNQAAHITICTANGIAPAYSNELLKEGNSIEYNDHVALKFGAFVVFEDDSTGWVYNSKRN